MDPAGSKGINAHSTHTVDGPVPPALFLRA